MSASAAESTAVMCLHERVTMMTAYVQFVQDVRDDGLPVSGDALTVMRKGTPAQRQHRREHAARPYGVNHDPDFTPRRIWPEEEKK